MNNNLDINFPKRNDLNKNGYLEKLSNDIMSVDVDKIDFEKADFSPRSKIIEKQRTYFWIRVYLNSEIKIVPNDDIFIKYIHSEEKLETKFICFGKKNLTKDANDEILNYDPEDDKKILCLMVDSDRINKNSEDIPFIRTLFKIGRYYEYQLMRRDELQILNSNNDVLEYYDIDF